MKLPEDGFDLAVVNGTIIDVVRQSFAQVNLGIRDGKIAAITSSPLEAREVIDARGRYVSPGFIDFHSHVDRERICGGVHCQAGRNHHAGRGEEPEREDHSEYCRRGIYHQSWLFCLPILRPAGRGGNQEHL